MSSSCYKYGTNSLLRPMMSQAFVVVGGKVQVRKNLHAFTSEITDSVMTLLPGASSWTELVQLPTPLTGARASIVEGNIRLVDFVLITLQDRSFPIKKLHLRILPPLLPFS